MDDSRSAAWDAVMDWRTGTHTPRPPTRPRPVWQPAPAPGVISRRPLRFFESLDGGFRLLRFAPALTVGLALIVFTLWMLALGALAAGLVWAASGFLTAVFAEPEAAAGFTVIAQFGAFAASLSSLSLVHLLAGVTAIGTRRAFDSRRMTLKEGWAALSGVRLRLVLVTVLLSAAHLVALVLACVPALVVAGLGAATAAIVLAAAGILAWLAFTVVFALRTAFTGCAIAHERLSIARAVGRSWRLTGTGFWRTAGQLLLGWFLSNQLVTIIITPLIVLAYVLAIVVVIIAMGSGGTGPIALATALIIVALLVTFFTLTATAVLFAYLAGLVSVVYFDRLMRSEGYDLVLLREAEAHR